MNKSEFLQKLERALSGSMTAPEVREHINYYDNYISAQVRNGRGELEVVSELGEPRLIAKSIIDALNRAGGVTYSEMTDADYENTTANKFGKWWRKTKEKALEIALKMPGWVWLVILGTILLLVFAIAASILSLILPILLPVLCILLVIQVFKRQ